MPQGDARCLSSRSADPRRRDDSRLAHRLDGVLHSRSTGDARRTGCRTAGGLTSLSRRALITNTNRWFK
jgi:hypothetical protein